MEVTLAGIDPDTFDVDALGAGVERLAEIAPDAEPLRLVVAADFEAAVRERVADPNYAENYRQERLFGSAVAKTIPQDDGSIDLIVDAGVLHGDGPALVDLERLFAHEAYHIVTHRNGETLSDIRIRRGLPGLSHDGYFLGIAGVLTEEFRIERALCESGSWPTAEYRNVSGTLEGFAAEVLDGVVLHHPDEPIDRTCSTVLTAFSTLTTLGGYLAAEAIVSDGERVPDVTLPMWDRYVGSAWTTLAEALRPVPSAAVRLRREALDPLVEPVAAACEEWLKVVGFTLADIEKDLYYFDVLTHDFLLH